MRKIVPYRKEEYALARVLNIIRGILILTILLNYGVAENFETPATSVWEGFLQGVVIFWSIVHSWFDPNGMPLNGYGGGFSFGVLLGISFLFLKVRVGK